MLLKCIGVTSSSLAAVCLALAAAETMRQSSAPSDAETDSERTDPSQRRTSHPPQAESQICRRPVLSDPSVRFLDLPALTVGLSGAVDAESLRLGITLECRNQLTSAHTRALEQAMPALRNWLIEHLSHHDPIAMLGSAAQESVRDAIRKELQILIDDRDLIRRVLFREFILTRPTASIGSTVVR